MPIHAMWFIIQIILTLSFLKNTHAFKCIYKQQSPPQVYVGKVMHLIWIKPWGGKDKRKVIPLKIDIFFWRTTTSEQETALPVSHSSSHWLQRKNWEMLHYTACSLRMFSSSGPVFTVTSATTRNEGLDLSSMLVWKSCHVAH